MGTAGATATATVRGCAVVMVEADGATLTVGVIFAVGRFRV